MMHKIDFCQLYLLSDTVTFQAYYAKTGHATYAWFCLRRSDIFMCEYVVLFLLSLCAEFCVSMCVCGYMFFPKQKNKDTFSVVPPPYHKTSTIFVEVTQ